LAAGANSPVDDLLSGGDRSGLNSSPLPSTQARRNSDPSTGSTVRSRVLAKVGLQVDDRRGKYGFHAMPTASQADGHPN
jgi:hypothetical protein